MDLWSFEWNKAPSEYRGNCDLNECERDELFLFCEDVKIDNVDANKNAPMRVNPSPRLKPEPVGAVKKYKPILTMITPMMFPALGIRRSITNCAIGVKTTIMPVIKPDFEAVVMCSP